MATSIFDVSQKLRSQQADGSGNTAPTNSVPPSVKLPSEATPKSHKSSSDAHDKSHDHPDTHVNGLDHPNGQELRQNLNYTNGHTYTNGQTHFNDHDHDQSKSHASDLELPPHVLSLGKVIGSGAGEKVAHPHEEQKLGERNGSLAEADEEDEGRDNRFSPEGNGYFSSQGTHERLPDPYHDASDGKDRLDNTRSNNSPSNLNGALTDSPSDETAPHNHSNHNESQYDHQTRPSHNQNTSFAANGPTVPFRTLPGGGKRLHKNSFVK